MILKPGECAIHRKLGIILKYEIINGDHYNTCLATNNKSWKLGESKLMSSGLAELFGGDNWERYYNLKDYIEQL